MSFDFDDFDVRSRYIDLDFKTEELNGLLESLPDERLQFDERCRIAYIYHDNALDGVVLTYHELRAAVDRKVMSDTTLIPTYQQIKNHCDALELIREKVEGERPGGARSVAPQITVDLVYELHVLLNRNLSRKKPGVLRHDMPLHRTYFHQIADPQDIQARLKQVCESVDDPDFRAQHPINQACLFEYDFMSVFPFSEGSGKIGRLLANYFLIRGGYLPAVIHACDRQRYYESLRSGPEGVRVLVIDSMEAVLETGLRHLEELYRAQQGVRRARRLSAGG